MPELMNLNHLGSEISHLGSERAEQIAQRLRQYEPDTTPTEETREAIRAAGTMANLTLFAWDAVQQLVANGAEGGQARERVEKAFLAIELWLSSTDAVKEAGARAEKMISRNGSGIFSMAVVLAACGKTHSVHSQRRTAARASENVNPCLPGQCTAPNSLLKKVSKN